MRIVSFNVNGIRARLHQLHRLIEDYAPDIIGLQEIKVQDLLFPMEDVEAMGYRADVFGQKSHYGVALLTRLPNASNKRPAPELLSVEKGFPEETEDDHRRWICGHYKTESGEFSVANGYFPQGENRNHPEKFPNKANFYRKTRTFLDALPTGSEVVLMGDMNISHQDIDIGIGEKNRKRWLQTGKCSFLPEEREWLENLLEWGLTDTFRKQYPDLSDSYSWFDYRSRGFEDSPRRGLRIDLILASANLAARCRDAGIALDIRGMEKPSDHSPIWADFDLT